MRCLTIDLPVLLTISCLLHNIILFCRCNNMAEAYLSVLQNRTALANTPGSLFFKQCEAASAKGDLLALLDRFVEQTDVLFTKIPEKGE